MFVNLDIKKGLESIILAGKFLIDAPMSGYTSLRVGGKADFLAMPGNEEELIQVIECLCAAGTPYFVMGRGTNLLVRDGGFRGVIVCFNKALGNIWVEGSEIRVQAGALLPEVAQAALSASLTGFEFAEGIPGSVGGAVYMNAGAYGREIGNVLKSAKVLVCIDDSDEMRVGEIVDAAEVCIVDDTAEVCIDGVNDIVDVCSDDINDPAAAKALVCSNNSVKGGLSVKEYTAADMNFGYRHSALKEKGAVLLEAVFQLEPGDQTQIKEKMREYSRSRQEKQPLTVSSAGSFFKRPKGHFAGKLIQEAGLMGLSIGGAMVSDLHAGFILNTGKASAKDILDLMEIVRATVFDRFGVMLEPEVRIIGEA